MRNFEQLWRDYHNTNNLSVFNAFNYTFRILVNNAALPYSDEVGHRILSLKKRTGLIAQDFDIGITVNSNMSLALLVTDMTKIVEGDKITLQAMIAGDLGNTAWYNMGVFFAGRPDELYFGRVQRMECWDAMMYANSQYFTEAQLETLPEDWTQTMLVALQDIASRMHSTPINPETLALIDPTFVITNPGRMTMREILGYIASAHGGNLIINDDGFLTLLVPKFGDPQFDVKYDNIKGLRTSPSETFSSLLLVKNDIGEHFTQTHPTSVGVQLQVFNIFGTQDIFNRIFNAIVGGMFTYTPINCDSVRIDLALELGDPIWIGGVWTHLWNYEMNQHGYVNIIAPYNGGLQRSYEFKGVQSKRIDRIANEILNIGGFEGSGNSGGGGSGKNGNIHFFEHPPTQQEFDEIPIGHAFGIVDSALPPHRGALAIPVLYWKKEHIPEPKPGDLINIAPGSRNPAAIGVSPGNCCYVGDDIYVRFPLPSEGCMVAKIHNGRLEDIGDWARNGGLIVIEGTPYTVTMTGWGQIRRYNQDGDEVYEEFYNQSGHDIGNYMFGGMILRGGEFALSPIHYTAHINRVAAGGQGCTVWLSPDELTTYTMSTNVAVTTHKVITRASPGNAEQIGGWSMQIRNRLQWATATGITYCQVWANSFWRDCIFNCADGTWEEIGLGQDILGMGAVFHDGFYLQRSDSKWYFRKNSGAETEVEAVLPGMQSRFTEHRVYLHNGNVYML